jgi:NTP pyrophosphatase (non-canonical NTP hydrolase)
VRNVGTIADFELLTAVRRIAEVAEGENDQAGLQAIREIAADVLAGFPHARDPIAVAVDMLVAFAHARSTAAGWWIDPSTGRDLVDDPAFPYIVGTKLMLIVSEIAEAMEGHRKGLNDDKLPHRPMIEVEFADALLRIGDLAGKLRMSLGDAVVEKAAFNAVRPDHKPGARMVVGGKAY